MHMRRRIHAYVLGSMRTHWTIALRRRRIHAYEEEDTCICIGVNENALDHRAAAYRV